MIFRISSAAFLAAARAFLTLIDIRCSSHVYCYELSRASCNHTPPCGPGCPSYDPSNQYPPYLFISLCPLYSPPLVVSLLCTAYGRLVRGGELPQRLRFLRRELPVVHV